MSNRIVIGVLLASIPLGFTQAESETVSKLLEVYSTEGAVTADVKQGEILWNKTFSSKGEFSRRSCTTCHTKDLTQSGKHVKTNKEIKPMAPSANPKRLTNIKKISKWFKRNCKWTMGRECTAQEKANMLIYIENQSKF